MMGQKERIRAWLIAGLFLVSLGGWLLHLRVHPLAKLPLNFIPFFAGLISFALLPVMFCFRKTIAYAYVINGMLVIIGTITMTHFSMAHPPERITVSSILTQTLFMDILILFVNFMIGKALFELQLLSKPDMEARHGRFLRYPNSGWWIVHLVLMSVVYALGRLLWP
jgi:hypothetical protein